MLPTAGLYAGARGHYGSNRYCQSPHLEHFLRYHPGCHERATKCLAGMSPAAVWVFIAICRRTFFVGYPSAQHAYAVKPFRRQVRSDLQAAEDREAASLGGWLDIAQAGHLVRPSGSAACGCGMSKRKWRARKPADPNGQPDQHRHTRPDQYQPSGG